MTAVLPGDENVASRASECPAVERYHAPVTSSMEFDPTSVVEWALESLRTSASTGVALGEEHLLLVANERARVLLDLDEIPASGIDWIALTPPEYRALDDVAISQVKLYGASSWYQKEFVAETGERRLIELLVLGLQTEPFRWLALLRNAGSSPLDAESSASERQHPSAVLRLAQGLAGASSLQDVMRIVDRLATGALQAVHVSLGLLTDDRSQLIVHHDPMVAPDIVQRHLTIEVSETTMLGRAAVLDVAELLDLDAYETAYPGYGADARRMNFVQLAAVPMHDQNGNLVGVMGIGWSSSGERELRQLEAVGDLIGDAIRLARDSDRNRATAAAFQAMLLPTQLDPVDPAEVAVKYRSVDRSVGGDFYDVITRADRTWFVIGDVVGHGISASRTMGKIRFFLRALLHTATDPAELLDALNDLVLAEGQDEVATCLVAVWDRDQHTLACASAGHLPQLLVTDGAARLLETEPDPPLGVARPGSSHPSLRLEIDHGGTLVLFTDGLVERRDVAIDEALASLREVVQSCRTLDVEALANRLIDIDAGDDDVAILAVTIPGRRRDR